MKNYDPNIDEGVHTVKTTVQIWGYKGTIVSKIHGNCHGLDILHSIDPYNENFEGAENDCDLHHDEYSQIFNMHLKNDNGDILEVNVDEQEFADMIVAVEIIDYVKD